MTMNEQDWRSLPAGRELDALVAERVMGWARTPYCGPRGLPCETWSPPKSERNYAAPPSYSTDIAAAWQVMEHAPVVFRAKEWRVVDGVWMTSDAWHAFIRELPNHLHHLKAAEVSLAICRAALAATEA